MAVNAAPTMMRSRRRRGGAAAASPAEAEKAGRWAAADVKRYNPTTGRHALIVEGGTDFRVEPAARPALQHVALVERKYRVIHRPEPKPAPEPEKPRPGKDKKKRSKPDAKADKADESPRKRRRKAKSPVKAIRPEDASKDTFRVILLQPEADWDVDTFVENHLDQLWNILEEEASKVAPAAPSGAAAPPAETPEDVAAREITAAVASRLAEGCVVGWFQGPLEWGPRALGNRSILANPADQDMQEIVNTKIKFREPFRPFAPSVLAERAHEYFEIPDNLPECSPEEFMLSVVPVREAQRAALPSITHVDGTARIHLVRRDVNNLFYDLILAFDHLTGVPIVLNTSFNLQGEAMVNSPYDALETFSWSGLDFLVMGNFVVSKGDIT